DILVRTDGLEPVHDLLVVDMIPAETEIVDTNPRATCDNLRVCWNLAALLPGKEEHFTVQLRPRQLANLILDTTAFVQVSKKQLLTKVADHPVQILVDPPPPVAAGQKFPMKFNIRNQGDAPLSGLRLTFFLRDEISHPAKTATNKAIEADLPVIPVGDTKIIDVFLDAIQPGECQIAVEVTDSEKNNLRKLIPVVIQPPPGLY